MRDAEIRAAAGAIKRHGTCVRARAMKGPTSTFRFMAAAAVLTLSATAASAEPDSAASSGTIANKSTILRDVDRAFGRSAPPSIEYIFVNPGVIRAGAKEGLNSETSTNPFGHALVRYTLPDGTQKIMNIVGKPGREMVNFLSPADYLYGRNVLGSEQGGALNRSMMSVRIEHVSPEQVVALDRYYADLKARFDAGRAKFDLAAPVARNALNKLIPGDQAEVGNCALWTSKGLVAAGIIKSPTMWPKKLFAQVLEQQRAIDPANVHVVKYQQLPEGNHGVETHGMYAPLALRKNVEYWDLTRRADVIVRVAPGTNVARADIVQPAGASRALPANAGRPAAPVEAVPRSAASAPARRSAPPMPRASRMPPPSMVR